MPFDALGMCVGPDEEAEEDEWDSNRPVSQRRHLLPFCQVSVWHFQPPSDALGSLSQLPHVSCGAPVCLLFLEEHQALLFVLSLPTTQSQVQLSSFYEPLGFRF